MSHSARHIDDRLLVGGPYDGEWCAISHEHENLYIPIRPGTIIATSDPDAAAARPPAHRYRRVGLYIDQVGVQILVHDDLISNREILLALINGYRRPST